jgi:TolA-binding protein
MRRSSAPAIVLAFLLGGTAHAGEGKKVNAGESTESPIADYFNELESIGLLDKTTGTKEKLADELGRAEATLEAGDPLGAAVQLYALVESPGYTDFSDFPEYQNAEYDLAVALFASGAYESSLSYIDRILARGPGALYWAAAHRRAVDIALETRTYDDVLKRLESTKLNEAIPVEATGERAYLRARVLYAKADYDGAEGELARISRKSRLYSSALYLRGVIRARRGEYQDATDAFCEIVETSDTDRYTFAVDDRYFGIKDLARLGLGRIAHEQDRYDDAYYHYFQIPEDSDKLPEALFEAGWSMYQKRELDTARDLVATFLKEFPDSPLAPEAMLLAGYIELADCQFDTAQKKFDQVVVDLQPVVNAAAAIQKSQAKQRAIFDKAVEREQVKRKDPDAAAQLAAKRTPEERVLRMMRVDPQFLRVHEAALGLRREAADAPHVVAAWRQLAARVRSGKGKVGAITTDTTPEQEQADKADELVQDTTRLRAQVIREKKDLMLAVSEKEISTSDAADRLGELDKADTRLRDLLVKAEAASEAADKALLAKAAPRLAAMIQGDLDHARELSSEASTFASKIDATADKLAAKAATGLYGDLRKVLDKAKLGKIDAVIGQKRKAEIQVEDMAQGRFPPELYNKLLEEGLIGDDEELWPSEGEYWKDEYEGYR